MTPPSKLVWLEYPKTRPKALGLYLVIEKYRGFANPQWADWNLAIWNGIGWSPLIPGGGKDIEKYAFLHEVEPWWKA